MPYTTPPKILVVDDDPIARELVAACLGTCLPGEILHAGDGKEAIAIVEAHRVALIVSDLNMPDYDGVEMLAVLAQHAIDVPVVIVSGAAGPILKAAVMLARARGLNVLGALGKPVERGQLRSLLEGAMAA